MINNPEKVKRQYQSPDNLNARVLLHSKYSVNKQGYSNWIFDCYEFFNGCKILELGCGTAGMWQGRLDSIGAGSTLVLSDLFEGMLELARENTSGANNVEHKIIDIQNIPYTDGTFDFVIANMMLYHVPDLSAALAEVRRVLKPGGKFYAATIGENGINKFLSEALAPHGVTLEINKAFTLQSGANDLSKHFQSVQSREYIDSLEVTDTNDMVNYVLSLTAIMDSGLDRNTLYDVFESMKQNGVIHVPKQNGMFIAQ